VVDLIVTARERVIPGKRQDQVEIFVVLGDRAGSRLLVPIPAEALEPIGTTALGEICACEDRAVWVGEDGEALRSARKRAQNTRRQVHQKRIGKSQNRRKIEGRACTV